MPGTHIRDLGDVCTCCIGCVCGGGPNLPPLSLESPPALDNLWDSKELSVELKLRHPSLPAIHFPGGLLSVPAFAYNTPCPWSHCLLLHTQTPHSLTGTLPPEPTQHLPPADLTPGCIRPSRGPAPPALCCLSRPGQATSPPGGGDSQVPLREGTLRPRPHPVLPQPRSRQRPCAPVAASPGLIMGVPASALFASPSLSLPSHLLPLNSISYFSDFYSIPQTAIIFLPPNLPKQHYTSNKGKKSHPQCHWPVASTGFVPLRPSRLVRTLSAVVVTALWFLSRLPGPPDGR